MLLGNAVVGETTATHFTITAGLQLGRTYELAVRAFNDAGPGSEAVRRSQIMYVNAVTTPQRANPGNPLAGRDWGIYMGDADPYWQGWSRLATADRDRLALPAVTSKAKFFGSWISDGEATKKTKEYIGGAQAGDPSADVPDALPDVPVGGRGAHRQAAAHAGRAGVLPEVRREHRQGDRSERVAVVVQPDGYFAKVAYDAFGKKVGRKKALLPARMLAWTSKTLPAANASVYVDMGSRTGRAATSAPVAKFLKPQRREVRPRLLAQRLAQGLPRPRGPLRQGGVAGARSMGVPGKHAVLDTSDNGQPFAGEEINPGGLTPTTPPADIGPATRTPTSRLHGSGRPAHHRRRQPRGAVGRRGPGRRGVRRRLPLGEPSLAAAPGRRRGAP